MKTSPNPQGVIDNPNDFNLTAENISEFLKYMKEKMILNEQNKTYTNITNGTLDEPNPHQVPNCHEYCDSQMRSFFEGYKHYHGYVTLVVSIIRLI